MFFQAYLIYPITAEVHPGFSEFLKFCLPSAKFEKLFLCTIHKIGVQLTNLRFHLGLRIAN